MGEDDPQATDPMGLQCSCSDAIVEVWAARMAQIIATTTFSQAFHAHLDAYLTSSETVSHHIQQQIIDHIGSQLPA